MTPDDIIAHEQAEECYLCGKVFRCHTSCKGCENCHFLGGKVKDHDHLLDKHHLPEGKGNYRGPAHYVCNIKYRQEYYFGPVSAHNDFRFDFQLILEELSKHSYPKDLEKGEYVPKISQYQNQRTITCQLRWEIEIMDISSLTLLTI